MKKLTLILTILLALTVAPALAMNHNHDDHSGHNHGESKASSHQGHGGHGADGNLLELGDATVKGVEAHAEMKDVKAAMAKMGMKTTHHFMIMFHDAKSGKAIESGKVAVKITGPDGTVTGPMELMGMQGHFGVDVILDKPGTYAFQVGSKLADGENRQFEFKTAIK